MEVRLYWEDVRWTLSLHRLRDLFVFVGEHCSL